MANLGGTTMPHPALYGTYPNDTDTTLPVGTGVPTIELSPSTTDTSTAINPGTNGPHVRMTHATANFTLSDDETVKEGMSDKDYSIFALALNHGIISIVAFSLLTVFSVVTCVLYLTVRNCRKGSGQLLLFLYSISLSTLCMLMLFGFYHPPLKFSLSIRLSCVVISVTTHVFILLSFGILLCYGFHLINRLRPPKNISNCYAIKSVLPTAGLSIALPIALSVVRPNEYVDNYACCFPRDTIATYAIFLPVSLILVANFIILLCFPWLSAPSISESRNGLVCCRYPNGLALDWTPSYDPESPEAKLHQLERRIRRQRKESFSFDPDQSTDSMTSLLQKRPSCLHILAIIGLGMLEAGFLMMFYISNFSPTLKIPNSSALPTSNPEASSYHIGFLVMGFLLGISLLLEMTTLEEESLHACKSCCYNGDRILIQEENANNIDSPESIQPPNLAVPSVPHTTSAGSVNVERSVNLSQDVPIVRQQSLGIGNDPQCRIMIPPEAQQMAAPAFSIPRNLSFSMSHSSPQINIEEENEELNIYESANSRKLPISGNSSLPRRLSFQRPLRVTNRPTEDEEDIYDNLPNGPPPLPPKFTAYKKLSRSARYLSDYPPSLPLVAPPPTCNHVKFADEQQLLTSPTNYFPQFSRHHPHYSHYQHVPAFDSPYSHVQPACHGNFHPPCHCQCHNFYCNNNNGSQPQHPPTPPRISKTTRFNIIEPSNATQDY